MSINMKSQEDKADGGLRKIGRAVGGIKHRAVAIKSLVGLMEDSPHGYENHGDTRESDIKRVVDRLAYEIEGLVDGVVEGSGQVAEVNNLYRHELYHATVSNS